MDNKFHAFHEKLLLAPLMLHYEAFGGPYAALGGLGEAWGRPGRGQGAKGRLLKILGAAPRQPLAGGFALLRCKNDVF